MRSLPRQILLIHVMRDVFEALSSTLTSAFIYVVCNKRPAASTKSGISKKEAVAQRSKSLVQQPSEFAERIHSAGRDSLVIPVNFVLVQAAVYVLSRTVIVVRRIIARRLIVVIRRATAGGRSDAGISTRGTAA